MRLLGIDYGQKRIGLALSGEAERIASPYAVWPRTADLAARIARLCREQAVGKIILGQSLDFKQKPNPIMRQIEKFKRELAQAIDLPIIYESEVLTSSAAQRVIGQDDELDARAAALILQSYLDRHAGLA